MYPDKESHTLREIMSQGETWAATITAAKAQMHTLADWLRQPRSEVLFTGCGSTHYLSLSAAATWQSLTGIRAHGLPASELWLFPDANLPRQPSLLVTVSRSGETTETLNAMEAYLTATACDYLAISCYADSELAKRSPRLLLAEHAYEESIAQTRSFTSMYLLAQMIAGFAARRDDHLEQLNELPNHFNRLVETYAPLAKQLADNWRLERFVFLGSGVNYGLASEAMLKMKEMSLSPSEVFHFLEFRHGPKSMVGPGTLIVGLVSDEARQHELMILKEMHDLGGTTLAITETARDVQVDYVIELNSSLNQLARSLLFLPVLQLIAYHRAINKGLDPDCPANLEAVVKF
jgi:glucosamine--fructose-6-phosphate aminotransferase (isomerizing)